jgi:gliding motility-associated-like protein
VFFKLLTTFLGIFFCGALNAQLRFVENLGQWPSQVLFRADLQGGKLYVERDALVFQRYDRAKAQLWHHDVAEGDSLLMHAYRMRFCNAAPKLHAEGEHLAPEFYNFIHGNNPAKWAFKAQAYASIWLRGLYPGVDLELSAEGNSLKYNLHLQAGVDPSRIGILYEGVGLPTIFKGRLHIETALGAVQEHIPLVYNPEQGTGDAYEAAYMLKGDTVKFHIELPQRFKGPLVIDPVLVFSTYSGSFADNFGCTGTYDDFGNAYAGGTVFDFGFPTSMGSYQPRFGGGDPESRTGYGGSRDMGILKFSPDGKRLLYATYLGGSSNEQPHSMIVDPAGNLVILGSTRSADFPNTGKGWDLSHNGDYDIILAKLNASGTGLMAATFVGGSGIDGMLGDREPLPDANGIPLMYNYADEFRGEVLCDSMGNIYLSSTSYSADFPLKNQVQTFAGNQDAVVMCMDNSLNQLKWSTCLGGTGYDAGYGLALGLNQDIFISGGTNSTRFPLPFQSFANTNRGGMADGFLVRLNRYTGVFQSGLFVGTPAYDQCYFVQTDTKGRPYVFGQTEGSWYISPGVFGNAGGGQFITRFRSDLSAIDLSTAFGSGGQVPNISPSAFLVDRCDRIFVSGWGGSTNSNVPKSQKNRGNTRNMPITPNAVQRTTDGSDFYIAVLGRNFSKLLYGTYFGGISTRTIDADEHVDGGTSRFDKKGIIYQAVCAGCGQNGLFPTTPGAYSRTNNSDNCNNAIFKIDFENLNQKPVSRDTIYRITATEVLNFNIVGTDPDEQDTVYLEIERIGKAWDSVQGPYPVLSLNKGAGRSVANVQWNTNCNHSGKDTFLLRVRVHDQGCPKMDTTWNTIKILVEPPPVVEPPGEICLLLNETTGVVSLQWPASPAHQYWKCLILKRQEVANVITLDTIRNASGGSFTDRNAMNPRVRNYCYFFIGVNTCNVVTDRGFRVCTQKELNAPIDSTYIITATVVDDKEVQVIWLRSGEADFGSYELYRASRDGKQPYKIIATITNRDDSFYTDRDVLVDLESYCYKVRVLDRCGHVSNKSNRACTIVLKGDATGKPQYYFDLSWMEYDYWKGGVSDYVLERRVDTGTLRPLVALPHPGFDFRDNKLNYDWGGYFYRVKAREASGGYNAESNSNEIYLFQPPELYVPDALTPNGDEINDVWGTVPVFVRDYHMMVFNRWGEKVFDSKDKKLQWKGVMGSGKPSDNVFAWMVVYMGWDNRRYTQQGVVHVLE